MTAIFLYVGPQAMLPLASGLAALAGVVLMFWRYLIAGGQKTWRFLLGQRRQPSTDLSDSTTTN